MVLDNPADVFACLQFGNWQYVSGVGNDARASRQFNPVKQGNDVRPSAPSKNTAMR